MKEIEETATMRDLLDNPEIPKSPKISGFPEKNRSFNER